MPGGEGREPGDNIRAELGVRRGLRTRKLAGDRRAYRAALVGIGANVQVRCRDRYEDGKSDPGQRHNRSTRQ